MSVVLFETSSYIEFAVQLHFYTFRSILESIYFLQSLVCLPPLNAFNLKRKETIEQSAA